MATDWHAVASCSRCDWVYEERGKDASTTRAANAHMKDKEHAAHEAMHRTLYCETLGCPLPEDAPG